MSSLTIRFNLDQSKILSSGNELRIATTLQIHKQNVIDDFSSKYKLLSLPFHETLESLRFVIDNFLLNRTVPFP